MSLTALVRTCLASAYLSRVDFFKVGKIAQLNTVSHGPVHASQADTRREGGREREREGEREREREGEREGGEREGEGGGREGESGWREGGKEGKVIKERGEMRSRYPIFMCNFSCLVSLLKDSLTS